MLEQLQNEIKELISKIKNFKYKPKLKKREIKPIDISLLHFSITNLEDFDLLSEKEVERLYNKIEDRYMIYMLTKRDNNAKKQLNKLLYGAYNE
jgi:hypothetical protein